MRRLVASLIVFLAAVAASGANASQVISTSSVSDVQLGVNDNGQAMVTYTAAGKVVHVLASGAVNAVAPTSSGAQVAFGLVYHAGSQTHATDDRGPRQAATSQRDRHDRARQAQAAAEASQTFSCPAYDGPPLADMIAACKAPDGSYWAVQSWDRDLPSYGVTPTAVQSQTELHLAHWTGALPVLSVHADWAYGGKWNHLWGTYTYDGSGVYGFRSTATGVPLDSFGRNVYMDTYGSAYGAGWKRLNSFVTHGPGGSWCYTVSPHGGHPAGTGATYRLTVMGPGVTPDLSVTVPAPGPYNAAAQAPDDAALRALNDPACAPH
jgi:hypothetical protein